MSDEKKWRTGLIGSLVLNGLVFVVTAWWIWQAEVTLQDDQMAGLVILLVFLFGLTALCALGPGTLTRFVSKFWLVLGLVWLLPGYIFWFFLVEPGLPGPIFLQRVFVLGGGGLLCLLEAVFLYWASFGTESKQGLAKS